MREQVGPPQLVDGRDDLAVGEVAGRPEQDDDRRVRHALEPQALAQDVLGRLGPRRPLALPREAQVLHRQRRVLVLRALGRRRRGGRRVGARLGVAGVPRRAPAPVGRRGGRDLAVPRYSVLTAWPPNSLRSAASTLAPYESSWRERNRVSSDSVMTGRRHVVVDGLLDGPAALAGVGHEALEVLEVRAVRPERPPGQFQQPRADDRALHPQLGDRGEVEVVVARVHDLEAFGVRLHQAVFDAVVDHLHVVARTRARRCGGSRPSGASDVKIGSSGVTASASPPTIRQ